MFEYQKEQVFSRYITELSKLKDHVVIISIRDTFGIYFNPQDIEALKALGLKGIDYNNIRNNHWKGYVAVISKQNVVFEKMGALNESVRFNEKVEGIDLDILSSPLKNVCISSILIDREEYSPDRRSFNIVVYYLPKGLVTDSVSFDMHVTDHTCFRNPAYMYNIIKPRPKRSLLIRNIEPIITRLKVYNMFPETEITKALQQIKQRTEKNNDEEKNTEKKIKVRIFYWGWFTFWNAIESVVKEFLDDTKYDVLVVYLSAEKETVYRLGKTGVAVMSDEEYEIEKDAPDIVIYNYAPGFYKTCSSIKISAYITLGLVIGIHEKRNPDKVLAHLCGKYQRVVLWAFDHEWDTVSVAFDLYIKAFIDYFNAHSEMALIIRPHPNYTFELLKRGIWTKNDLEVVKEICDHSENIIWDESADYGVAYKLSNGIITDINCGITISALALDKPLAVLHRFDVENTQEPQFPEVIENIYNLFGIEDLYDFFEMIKEEDDYLKDERKKILEKYISNFDGKNGERIKAFIEEKYNEKTQERMTK